MKIMLCDRCSARTDWSEALEDAGVSLYGKGVQPVTLVWGKDLCKVCRVEVIELLQKKVPNIFGEETAAVIVGSGSGGGSLK